MDNKMLHFATDQDRCNQLARQHVNAAYKMENKRVALSRV